jgi:hypothetical protein
MEPNRNPDEVFAELAVMAGLLKAGEPMPPAVRTFAECVVTECAALGDGYGNEDETAGDQIRASFLK